MRLNALLSVLSLSLVGFGSSSTCSASTEPESPRPYELKIYRHSSSIETETETNPNPCTFLSLKSTQQHKRLQSQTDVSEKTGRVFLDSDRRDIPSLELEVSDLEYVRLRSHSRDLLLERARSLCGPPSSWQFPIYMSDPLDEQFMSSIFSNEDESQQIVLSVSDSAERIVPNLRFISPPTLDITSLIESGPSSNRVDLVFFSDGYMKDEHDKFVQDAQRLAEDISGNQTFSTVRPLLNFWAAFSPSDESGVGVGGQPKNTTFGLYRDGTELRGLYYDKPEIARAACASLGDGCDYPILLGNDPLYGGLGGEFTTVTASLLNGPLVLRHELGHSIIDVGEEYDGGYAYFGVNAADNRSDPFPWAHWLSANVSTPREERSVMPLQVYPWTLLNASSPWTVTFNSSGAYSRYYLQFSLSGIPEKDHLKVKMDGVDLGWVPRKDIGVDRTFYDLRRGSSLEEGEHTIAFTLSPNALEGKAQLCSLEVLEYGDESEFETTPGYIGAFPTFSDANETSYRPTDDSCLMRLVTTPNFCQVCIEGLWLALLSRVDLIDDVQIMCVTDMSGTVHQNIEVTVVPLAQFRDESSITAGEEYIVTWSKDGEVLAEHANMTSIAVDDVPGVYSVEIEFVTGEVRLDREGYLKSARDIGITGTCHP